MQPRITSPQAKWKSPLTLVAPGAGKFYRDTFVEFGKTYVYVVRSVALTPEGSGRVG